MHLSNYFSLIFVLVFVSSPVFVLGLFLASVSILVFVRILLHVLVLVYPRVAQQSNQLLRSLPKINVKQCERSAATTNQDLGATNIEEDASSVTRKHHCAPIASSDATNVSILVEQPPKPAQHARMTRLNRQPSRRLSPLATI